MPARTPTVVRIPIREGAPPRVLVAHTVTNGISHIDKRPAPPDEQGVRIALHEMHQEAKAKYGPDTIAYGSRIVFDRSFRVTGAAR